MAKINIRPTSAVYATYKRLSYQPWTAIAEFVDNSTQSYFDHREELKSLPDFKKLTIDITYESNKDGKDTLTIIDYAMVWSGKILKELLFWIEHHRTRMVVMNLAWD